MNERAEMQVFDNANFGTLRTTDQDGEPWFVAADICRVLEIKNVGQAIDRLDDDEWVMLNIGRQGNAYLVNEPGLYSLIMASRKPQAKSFKRWVTHDVLPAIRQAGLYALCNEATEPQRLFSPEDYLSAARIISHCRTDRLPYILSLLSSGGWELSCLPSKKIQAVDTSDISERIKRLMLSNGRALHDLCSATGVSYEVLRSYYYGNRFPRAERYNMIITAIENLERSYANDSEVIEV